MTEHFTCPVCLETIAGARVALCGHGYCASCYYDMVDRSQHPSCAVCRRPLDTPPYPNYEVDALLDRDDEAFKARVQCSRRAALEAESRVPDRDVPTPSEMLRSDDATLRRVALEGLLHTAEQVLGFTCAELAQDTLRRVVHSANYPANRDEAAAAWRLLAHAAVHFRDAGVLVGMGVHSGACRHLMSDLSSVPSRRAVSRVVASLADTHPSYFSLMLEPAWVVRLAAAAPAALAHAALALRPGGLMKLADASVLSTVLLAVGEHERTLAARLLGVALDMPECCTQVQHAASLMLLSPVVHAESLRTICWKDETAARVIATCHQRDIAAAVRTCSSSVNEEYDVHTAVLDIMHALHDVANMCSPALVSDVLRWMLQPGTPPSLHSFGLAFVASCARSSRTCALAVCRHYGSVQLMLDDPNDDAAMYMAGDVFTHEDVVAAYQTGLALALETMSFTRYPAVYFASSLAHTVTGLRLVRENALPTLRAQAASLDEATLEAMQNILHACQPGD
jgi:hypothetical protein